MIDLLCELINGRMSIEKAEEIYDQTMDSSEAGDTPTIIGLSPTEWTAFCQGAPFDILAHWRYEGWPSICTVCSEEIEINKYGWFVIDQDGDCIIVHIRCLEKLEITL